MFFADTKLLHTIREDLVQICGRQYVLVDEDDLLIYRSDMTLNMSFPFDILVRPGTANEIGQVLKICGKYKMPVTPRGGGSGVTGGALPVKGGMVLSLDRMNRILHINTVDGFVVAEAGVVTEDLCKVVEKTGLYFPAAPSSRAFSFIGGNVATNAGSINSCKYGTTAHYVMNLEVVLASGKVLWTGSNVTKSSTGLNLTQLFVGSEGTLGIISKIVYRLLPPSGKEVCLLAGFEDLEDACDAIMAIKQSGLSPSATELICRSALRLTENYLKEPPLLPGDNIEAHLLIGIQDTNSLRLEDTLTLLVEILAKYTKEDILKADSFLEKEKFWRLRLNVGNAMTSVGKTYRDIDVCVPLSSLYEYIMEVEGISKKYDIPMACFGHALDGNMHTMLLLDEEGLLPGNPAFQKAIDEIYLFAISKGGVISGEHGIGLLQKDFMQLQFPDGQLTLMQELKKVFDPKGILNPGKTFDH